MIRLPHLTWPQRLAVAAGCLAFALAGGLELAQDADARPLPAHHVVAGMTQGVCQPSGAWSATLVVTADVPNGTAHLEPTGNTGFDYPMGADGINRLFPAIDPKFATFSVTVTVRWPDFTAAPVTVTATRPPDGCVAPTTSTTTCGQAIPIRDDCEVPTSTTAPVPPTTTPSASGPPTSLVATTAPTVPPASSTTPRPPSTPRAPTSTVRISLPATGSSPLVPVAIGVGLVLAGILLATRKWTA